jgi:hypothetical protein
MSTLLVPSMFSYEPTAQTSVGERAITLRSLPPDGKVGDAMVFHLEPSQWITTGWLIPGVAPSPTAQTSLAERANTPSRMMLLCEVPATAFHVLPFQ